MVLRKRAKIITAVLLFCMLAVLGTVTERLERDAFIMETSVEEPAVDYQSDSEAVIDGKININSAGEEELVQLYGIGSALAERITEYRSENGEFSSIEEIMKVSGISRKKFEAIKDNICAE